MRAAAWTHLSTLFLLTALCVAPSRARAQDKDAETSAAQSAPATASGAAQAGPRRARMSRQFSVAALQALSALKRMRTDLTYTLESGYPLSRYWVVSDRQRAVDALDLASVAVSTRADRAVLRELLRHDAALEQWSDDLLRAQREMRLAEYYISPTTLQDDPQYRAVLAGEESLTALVADGRTPLPNRGSSTPALGDAR